MRSLSFIRVVAFDTEVVTVGVGVLGDESFSGSGAKLCMAEWLASSTATSSAVSMGVGTGSLSGSTSLTAVNRSHMGLPDGSGSPSSCERPSDGADATVCGTDKIAEKLQWTASQSTARRCFPALWECTCRALGSASLP